MDSHVESRRFSPSEPMRSQDSEDLAQEIAVKYLPDTKKLQAAIDAKELKIPETIGRWEMGIISARAWAIFNEKKAAEYLEKHDEP